MAEDAQAELSRAVRLATAVHEHHRDKSGAAYILHPLRVMLAVPPSARVAGVLHDVIEDSDHTAETLRAAGIGATNVEAIDLLTRPDGMSYEDFIARVAAAEGEAGEIARAVKRADIQDNLGRMTDALRAERPWLADRYEAALKVLEQGAEP